MDDITLEFEAMLKMLQDKKSRLITIAGQTGQGFSVNQMLGICEDLEISLQGAITRHELHQSHDQVNTRLDSIELRLGQVEIRLDHHLP